MCICWQHLEVLVVSPSETFSLVVVLNLSCGILFSSPIQGDCYHYILQNFCIMMKCKWNQIFPPSCPTNSWCLVEVSPFWCWSQPWAGFFWEGKAGASIGNFIWNHRCLFCDAQCCFWQWHFASAQEQSSSIPVSTAGEPGWFEGSKSNYAQAQALSHN